MEQMQQKTFYKIVLLHNRKLRSFITTQLIGEESPYSIQYRVKEWVSGPAPLMVFDSLESSKYFLTDIAQHLTYNYIIYKCYVKNPRQLLDISGSVSDFYIQRFWDNYEKPKMFPTHIPVGTYICDAVQLREKVKC